MRSSPLLAWVILAVGACSTSAAPTFSDDVTAPPDAVDAPPLDAPTADAPSFDAPTFDLPTADSAPRDASVDRGEASADAAPADAACRGSTTDPDARFNTVGEFTDPPSCAAPTCPGAIQSFALTPDGTRSVATVSGVASGSLTCTFTVVSAACGVEQGTLSIDPDSRAFTGTVPLFCGSNLVRVVCSSGSGRRIRVTEVMGRTCEGDDLRVTLTWDHNVQDGELHLVRSPGRINDPVNDCTWTTCIAPRVLDWGAPGDRSTQPVKDVDNVTTDGTEHITLTRAPANTYHVLAEHWNPGGSPGMMQVQINVQGRAPIVRSVPSIAAHWVWYVGDLVYPGGVFRPVDAAMGGHTGPLTDCTAMWTSPGCGMPLPQ